MIIRRKMVMEGFTKKLINKVTFRNILERGEVIGLVTVLGKFRETEVQRPWR